MKRLIVHGDLDVRKDGLIRHGGAEYRCFSVTRNGDWHGPAEPQLWCIVGDDDEREAFERREYVPHFLETLRAEPGEVEVLQRSGTPAD